MAFAPLVEEQKITALPPAKAPQDKAIDETAPPAKFKNKKHTTCKVSLGELVSLPPPPPLLPQMTKT